jgi:hypothetical protein
MAASRAILAWPAFLLALSASPAVARGEAPAAIARTPTSASTSNTRRCTVSRRAVP